MLADATRTSSLSEAQCRIAGGIFEHACRAVERRDYAYAIKRLRICCRLAPAVLPYRKLLRAAASRLKRRLPQAILMGVWYRILLEIASSRGRHAKALELGEQLLLWQPTDARAHQHMAAAAGALGETELALWLLHQGCGTSKRARFLRQLAELYEERGDIGSAVWSWDAVRKVDPTDRQAEHRARALAIEGTIVRGKYEETLNGCAKKSSRSPNTTPAGEPLKPAEHRLVGEAAYWREQITRQPAEARGYLQLGRLYRRAGLLDRAEEVLREGLAPTGDAIELRFALDELHIERLRRRLTEIERSLRTRSGSHRLKAQRERLVARINARELELYRRKTAYYPLETGYRFELGLRLFRGGHLDLAIREFQAVRSDPRQRWRALVHLAYCFKARKNWLLARRNFEEALQMLPIREDSWRKEILFELATGMANHGDLSEAIEIGLELANLDYHYRNIHRLLEDWQKQQQRKTHFGSGYSA